MRNSSSAYWIQVRDEALATAARSDIPNEWRKLAAYYNEMAVTATERELSETSKSQ